MDTQAITVAVDRIVPGASADQIAEAMEMLGAIGQFVRETKKDLDGRMIALLNEVDGKSLIIGNTKYWVRANGDKKVKCRNVSETIQAILRAAGGDEARLIACFASNWFKHGTIKRLFEEFDCPDEFERLFEVKEGDKLEIKELASADVRYLK